MKNQHSLNAIALVLCLFLLNCKEKEDVIPKTNTPGGPYASIDEVFMQMALKYKAVTINANRDTSFYGNSGTRYILVANSLIAMDGTPVNGDVKVEVCEYLDKGDMIFSKMLPVSNGQPLVSGGEIDIKASQSGKPLRLRKGYQFIANVPQRVAADSAMEFFRGEKNDDQGQNLVNWTRPVIDTVGQGANYYSKVAVVGTDTISIISDSLAMANCDRFPQTIKRYNITVNLAIAGTSTDDKAAIYTYAIYQNPTLLVGTGLYWKNNFSYNFPGLQAHFIAFTVTGGKFYGGTLTATPVENASYTVQMTAIDPVAFKQQLNKL